MPHPHTHTVTVVKRANGKFDLDVHHSNGNFLFGTNQGYENEKDAREMMHNFIEAAKTNKISWKNRIDGKQQDAEGEKENKEE